MLLAHKIALDPNKNQEIYFTKAADTTSTARFAYNWVSCEWICPECGVVDDHNINIFSFGLANLNGSTASSAGCNACGEEGSGHHRKVVTKPTSVKQEVSYVE